MKLALDGWSGSVRTGLSVAGRDLIPASETDRETRWLSDMRGAQSGQQNGSSNCRTGLRRNMVGIRPSSGPGQMDHYLSVPDEG